MVATQIFFIFTPKLEEDEPNLTCLHIFHPWVGEPTTSKNGSCHPESGDVTMASTSWAGKTNPQISTSVLKGFSQLRALIFSPKILGAEGPK